MKRHRAILSAGLLLGGIAVGRVALARGARASLVAAPATIPHRQGFTERGERDAQIRVWHQALVADPASAAALGQLAALHLQRAREGGGWDDYRIAESYARRSLGRRTNRNAPTAVTLVSVLLAEHRFAEAQAIAAGLVRHEPEIPQYRSLLGEVSMEIGDYSTAGRMFDSLYAERTHLSVAPRLARWAELNGRITEARRLLVAARDDALRRRDVARETQAWFELRVGDLDLRTGRLRAAEQAFVAGLAIEPDDPRLLAAMARLAAARHDHADVITWGDRAIGVQLDPGTLGLVGDAYAALGDSAKSAEYFRTLEVAVTAQPGPNHRAWSLYLLDHDLRVASVLAKAQQELRARRDIYGYDLVAWALYKSGRPLDAHRMMQQALQLHTPDALLARHARAIAAALAVKPPVSGTPASASGAP